MVHPFMDVKEGNVKRNVCGLFLHQFIDATYGWPSIGKHIFYQKMYKNKGFWCQNSVKNLTPDNFMSQVLKEFAKIGLIRQLQLQSLQV